MSIADKITTLKTEVQNAYSSIQAKSGAIPSSKNTQNIESSILSIPDPGLYMHNILFNIVSRAQDGNMLIVSTNQNAMTESEIASWVNSKGFTSSTSTYPAWGSGPQKAIYEFASSSTSTKSKYTVSYQMPSGVFSSDGTALKAKVMQSGTMQVNSVVDNVIKIS